MPKHFRLRKHSIVLFLVAAAKNCVPSCTVSEARGKMTTRLQEAIDWVKIYFKSNDCGWRSMPTTTTTGKRKAEPEEIFVLDREDTRLFPKAQGQPWRLLYENYLESKATSGVVLSWKAFKNLRGDFFPENTYRIEYRKCKEIGSNTSSTWRNTPLHLSCSTGNVELLKSILQEIANRTNNLNVDKQDYHLRTPLHHAVTATNDAIEIVRCLLVEGALCDIKDHNNETPIDIATRMGRLDIRTVIEDEIRIRYTNPGYKRPRLEDELPVPSLEVSVDNNDEEGNSESSDDEDD